MFSRLVEARQVITCVGRTRFWLGGGGPLPPGPPGLEAMAVVRSGAQGSARPSQDTRGPAYLQHGTLPWGHTSQPGPWTPTPHYSPSHSPPTCSIQTQVNIPTIFSLIGPRFGINFALRQARRLGLEGGGAASGRNNNMTELRTSQAPAAWLVFTHPYLPIVPTSWLQALLTSTFKVLFTIYNV